MVSRSVALKQLFLLRSSVVDPLRLAADGWDSDWKTLIAILLSARTRDEITISVCNVLFFKYSSLLDLSKANVSVVESIVRRVNYYRTKARHVVDCSRGILHDFGGVVPQNFDSLTSLPGVGRKTANVFLSECGVPSIGVDTHVFRLSRKLGWSRGKTPVVVEGDLKKLFPRSAWSFVNESLVSFGRRYRSSEDEKLLNLGLIGS
ncbi:endonuclease III [Candidatus Woesearchaeota archaeon]|nr:endonuclease III [Candidatus Woesearchaeota archaeon]